MVKRIRYLLVFSGIFSLFLGAYLYFGSKFSWRSVDNHSEVEIGEENSSEVIEIPLYRQKYDFAVEYILSFLGGDIELSDYIVVVDISEQTEYIFDKEGDLIDTYRISTGEDGTDKAMGESLWRVESKIDYEVAPLYGPRMMMLGRYVNGEWITTTVALHGTEEPDRIGTPFTLGCVYHNNADIITLFDILSIGDYVVAIE
ncbi:MAG: L,D-transpeptidase [bacterium]